MDDFGPNKSRTCSRLLLKVVHNQYQRQASSELHHPDRRPLPHCSSKDSDSGKKENLFKPERPLGKESYFGGKPTRITTERTNRTKNNKCSNASRVHIINDPTS
ncbi:unnamed protein product [Ophioblennius macclurei]